MHRILIIEDDFSLNNTLAYNLRTAGYTVDSAYNAKEAFEYLKQYHYILLILDINLPDGNGFELYSELKEKSNASIIFLTANDLENDIVKGFDLGADDYITKPFSVRELKARVNRVFMRQEGKNSVSVLKAKNINYDIEKKEVKKDGEAVSLSSLELRILDLLFCNHNKAVSRDAVIDCIWEATGNDVYDHTVTVYMKRIRQKIGDDVIKTVKGIGYRIDTEDN